VDRELRIIGNGGGNAGLAPLLGAWRMGAVTGGFARLRAAQPPAIICEPSGFDCGRVPGASTHMRGEQQPRGFPGAFSNPAFPVLVLYGQ